LIRNSLRDASELLESLHEDVKMQLKDEVLKIHPKFEAFALVHKTKFVDWKAEDFWRDCASHAQTILILKSEFNVLFGMYCPETWKDYGGSVHEI
jgi:hypothetical protein